MLRLASDKLFPDVLDALKTMHTITSMPASTTGTDEFKELAGKIKGVITAKGTYTLTNLVKPFLWEKEHICASFGATGTLIKNTLLLLITIEARKIIIDSFGVCDFVSA